MGANSRIEWTDHTLNPWEGCTKVSAGCAHCYAEARNARFGGGTAPNWGKGAPRRRTSVQNWNQPIKWNKAAALFVECGNGHRWQAESVEQEGFCPECGHPESVAVRPRVFCASLADWLDDEVPIEWLADLLALIAATQHLDWLLLTKRPQNWETRLSEVVAFACFSPKHHAILPWLSRWHPAHDSAGGVPGRPIPPAHVWIGTTVEDRPRADERIPALLKIPARVRFLSCEPLLGPVHFSDVTRRSDCVSQLGKPALAAIDWVICGGESGPGARPMHPDWARSLRDQCAAAGVAFFFKQWGEWAPGCPSDSKTELRAVSPGVLMGRFGKAVTGRKLQGHEHNAFPEVRS